MVIDGSQKSVPSDFILLSVPVIQGNEWKYVKECLDTGWVSSVGAFVDRFESEIAAYVGVPHAVAATNGTAALHLALMVAGVGPDDEVVLPSLTFVAPVNTVRYVGAWPVLVDADPETWQMDPERLAHFLTQGCERVGGVLRNRRTGRRVKAVIPVHVMGHPVDMDPVMKLAREFGLTVIEDASESLGARYKGTRVGAFGDVACFSFNGNKTITTGGGGMLVTPRADWAKRAKHLSTQAKDDPVEYVHGEVGYNYRLTNVQAAIGCAQLEQLDAYVRAKRAFAEQYARALGDVPGVSLMPRASWAEPIFWMYTIRVDPKEFGMGSRDLLRELGARRIQARPLWQPMHRSPAHQYAWTPDCPVADRICAEALSLPSSPNLTEGQIAKVTDAIRSLAGAGV